MLARERTRILTIIGGLVLATLVLSPAAATARTTTAHHDDHVGTHDWGPMGWHGTQVGWRRIDGSRHAVGHAWMSWDDCRGPVGLTITARFQRHVDGRWVTTQTRTRRHHFEWAGAGHDDDHRVHLRPTFKAHHADRTHPTRVKFTYRWLDDGRVHARHSIARALP